MIFRRGTKEDIEIITELRIEFLKVLGMLKESDPIEVLRDATYQYIQSHGDESFFYWVAEEEGNIVGMTGVNIVQKPPSLQNLSGKEGYVLNVYTLPDYRGQGIATGLMKELLSFLQDNRILKVRLAATEQGKSVYEKLGFVKDHNEGMILLLK